MSALNEHTLHLQGRKMAEITGVSSVESFDVHEFTLTTSGGLLQIQGTNLHMKHLDLQAGEAIVEGTISALNYISDKKKKKGFIKKMMR